MECEKAAIKAVKKMEKERKKVGKNMEKKQEEAMKMEKEEKKMAMSSMNGAWMKMILRAHQSPVTANARWRLSG
jgi:hypothetical protein